MIARRVVVVCDRKIGGVWSEIVGKHLLLSLLPLRPHRLIAVSDAKLRLLPEGERWLSYGRSWIQTSL
jgi:hypothetical protein